MTEKSLPKGHAVLTGGGCPFHRGTPAGPPPSPHPLVNKVHLRRNPVRSVRSSGALLDDPNSTDNGPTVTDFTRLFPLEASVFDKDELRSLTRSGGPMDDTQLGGAPQDNPTIPAGFTFLGQFLDHDMTFDVYSDINQIDTDPDQVRNALTPSLDLGNVYGRGPVLDAFLYAKDGATLVHGTSQNPDHDVCRNPVGTAIIGDPRNDDNLFVSQLELAFIKFHNFVVEQLRGTCSQYELFQRASTLVRWHYQWIVYNDFLPRFIGSELFEKLKNNGPQYYNLATLGIPVEFSAAAYRMGHSTVRQSYQVNSEITRQQVFDAHMPGVFVPEKNRIDWKYFFNTDAKTQPQACKLFDTFLASELLALPPAAVPGYEQFMLSDGQPDPLYLSLAGRNLLRQNEYNLPSGQTIAKALGEKCYSNAELGLNPSFWSSDMAPLWYYILKEARLANQGRFLGPVGGRIVGEVFFGILLGDPTSFLHNAGWKPTYGNNGTFTMADLLKISESFVPKGHVNARHG